MQTESQGTTLPAARDPRLKQVSVTQPLVSVIVTNYNYAAYIGQCLDSVRAQSYANWECIIVDDQSSDGSHEILQEYVKKHSKQRKFAYLRRAVNGGQMEAFRDGLAAAQGTFVMMLDADDVLLPDFLNTHVEVHLGFKAVAFTSSNQYHINEKGDIIGGNHADHLAKGEYRYVPQQVFQGGYWIWATASSMLFRRSTLNLILPDEGVTFRICADYYLAHFCQQVGNSILIPQVLGCYRRHEANNFSSNPLVGAINSMGDFSRHPPHQIFRQAIIDHVLTHYERFKPIFTESGIKILLYRVATFAELKQVYERCGRLFNVSCRKFLFDYWLFHKKRHFYDRSPWEFRLIHIEDPRYEHAPPPPEPGRIIYGSLKHRLLNFILENRQGVIR